MFLPHLLLSVFCIFRCLLPQKAIVSWNISKPVSQMALVVLTTGADSEVSSIQFLELLLELAEHNLERIDEGVVDAANNTPVYGELHLRQIMQAFKHP